MNFCSHTLFLALALLPPPLPNPDTTLLGSFFHDLKGTALHSTRISHFPPVKRKAPKLVKADFFAGIELLCLWYGM